MFRFTRKPLSGSHSQYLAKNSTFFFNVVCITWKLKCCVLLGYYAASNDSFLPAFRDNLSVPSSWVESS